MAISNSDLETFSKQYPNFKISQQNDNCTISGPIKLDHIYRDVRMTGLFELEINVSVDFPNTLPVVRELTEKIDRNYPHLYTNGQFCLASNLELKIYFLKNKNIATFVDDYIIPYLYTYCYYEKYGVYPYGERSHGIMGDLEYLKELLNVDDWGQLFKGTSKN